MHQLQMSDQTATVLMMTTTPVAMTTVPKKYTMGVQGEQLRLELERSDRERQTYWKKNAG